MYLRPGNFSPCAGPRGVPSFLGRNGFHRRRPVSVRIWEIWIFDMITDDLCRVITHTVPLSDLAGLVRRSNPSEAVVPLRDLNTAQHPRLLRLRRVQRIYLIVPQVMVYMKEKYKSVFLMILKESVHRCNSL